MATAIMMLAFIALTFVIAPWIGYVRRNDLHHVDMMAGGEGE